MAAARAAAGCAWGGQRALSDLFPGLEQDLVGAGAVPLRAGLDVRIEMPGYDPFPQRDLNRKPYWYSLQGEQTATTRIVFPEYVDRRYVFALVSKDDECIVIDKLYLLEPEKRQRC